MLISMDFERNNCRFKKKQAVIYIDMRRCAISCRSFSLLTTTLLVLFLTHLFLLIVSYISHMLSIRTKFLLSLERTCVRSSCRFNSSNCHCLGVCCFFLFVVSGCVIILSSTNSLTHVIVIFLIHKYHFLR